MEQAASDGHARRNGPPSVRETHMSWVFFAGDRAYKILKPVALPFLDLSDSAQRMAAVSRELDYNRRLAPDVYLGVSEVVEHGEVVDRVLVMKRLPSERRLSHLLERGEHGDCLVGVARAVADFHAKAEPVNPAPMATRDAVRNNWEENLQSISPHAGGLIDQEDFDRVVTLAGAYLDGRRQLFDDRIAAGWIRDGHGDLRAEDIFCLDDGPRIIDCLAFADEYRIADVLADIAFLVMDVARLADRQTAQELLGSYCDFTGEHHAPSLAHHYVAYRAHVRAKVACLRYEQGDEASGAVAVSYHDLALDHLERARVRLVLVGGGPGTGKSSLAGGLADVLGASVLATDEIRKDITGTSREEHRFAAPGEGIYDEATVASVYVEQRRQATALLERGESVILDASWTAEAHRSAAQRMAAETHAELFELECTIDPEIAKERIVRRMAGQDVASDATPDVVDHLGQRRDPWPSAVRLETSAPKEQVLDRAIGAITRR